MKVEHLVKDRESGCPFGMKCDDCNLYVPMYQEKQDGVLQKWNCQINNLVILMGESKDNIFRVQQSIESSRNESVKRQDQLLSIVGDQNASLPRQ